MAETARIRIILRALEIKKKTMPDVPYEELIEAYPALTKEEKEYILNKLNEEE